MNEFKKVFPVSVLSQSGCGRPKGKNSPLFTVYLALGNTAALS